jgi:hypothetical protein
MQKIAQDLTEHFISQEPVQVAFICTMSHLATDDDNLGKLRPQRRHRSIVTEVAHVG